MSKFKVFGLYILIIAGLFAFTGGSCYGVRKAHGGGVPTGGYCPAPYAHIPCDPTLNGTAKQCCNCPGAQYRNSEACQRCINGKKVCPNGMAKLFGLCKVAEDCICNNGQKTTSGLCCPGPNGGPTNSMSDCNCTKDDDCGSPYLCIGDYCCPPATPKLCYGSNKPPVKCDCCSTCTGPNSYCVNNQCCPESLKAQLDADGKCSNGNYPVDCACDCKVDEDCPAEKPVCAGKCCPAGTPKVCPNTGQTPVDCSCCSKDADCPGGGKCQNGQCICTDVCPGMSVPLVYTLTNGCNCGSGGCTNTCNNGVTPAVTSNPPCKCCTPNSTVDCAGGICDENGTSCKCPASTPAKCPDGSVPSYPNCSCCSGDAECNGGVCVPMDGYPNVKQCCAAGTIKTCVAGPNKGKTVTYPTCACGCSATCPAGNCQPDGRCKCDNGEFTSDSKPYCCEGGGAVSSKDKCTCSPLTCAGVCVGNACCDPAITLTSDGKCPNGLNPDTSGAPSDCKCCHSNSECPITGGGTGICTNGNCECGVTCTNGQKATYPDCQCCSAANCPSPNHCVNGTCCSKDTPEYCPGTGLPPVNCSCCGECNLPNKCVNGVCCSSATPDTCSDGSLPVNCKCTCPGVTCAAGKQLREEDCKCVDCLKDADCPGGACAADGTCCYAPKTVSGGVCKCPAKTCPSGQTMDPTTCECVAGCAACVNADCVNNQCRCLNGQIATHGVCCPWGGPAPGGELSQCCGNGESPLNGLPKKQGCCPATYVVPCPAGGCSQCAGTTCPEGVGDGCDDG